MVDLRHSDLGSLKGARLKKGSWFTRFPVGSWQFFAREEAHSDHLGANNAFVPLAKLGCHCGG